MPDVREKQREAGRKNDSQWASLPRRIDNSLRRRFPSSLGPPPSRTKKHSSAVVAIRMRRSWGGYYHVLISERPSPLPAAATSRPYQVAVTSRLPPRDPLCRLRA